MKKRKNSIHNSDQFMTSAISGMNSDKINPVETYNYRTCKILFNGSHDRQHVLEPPLSCNITMWIFPSGRIQGKQGRGAGGGRLDATPAEVFSEF